MKRTIAAPWGLSGRTRAGIVAVLIVISVAGIVWFVSDDRTGEGFIHFFYFPIILSSIWWPRRGVLVAAGLSLALFAGHALAGFDILILGDHVRAAFFLFVSFTVAWLSAAKEKRDQRYSLTAANLQAIFDNSIQAFLLLDTDRTIRTFNRRAGDYFLTYRDRAVNAGDAVEEYVQPDHRGDFLEFFAEALTGKTIMREWELVDFRGSSFMIDVALIPVRVEGDTVAVCMSINDITARKKAELALASSEERFRKLVTYSWDITTVIDQGAVITFASPSVERVMDRKADEVMGHSLFDLVHPDDRGDLESRLSAVMGGTGIVFVRRLRIARSDGSWVTVQAIANNQLDDPAIRGIIVNCQTVDTEE